MELTSEHPFWRTKNGILATYPPLLADETCEILILGAGITGSLLAEALTSDGHDVIVVDSRDIGCGSTSGSTALLQYEVDTHLIDLIERHGKTNAELAYLSCHESIDLLEQKIRALRIDCDFQRKDSVYLASTESDWPILRKEAAARQEIGIDVTPWDASRVASIFGFYRPGALHSTQAAEVDSYRLTHGLLDAASRQGARIFDRTAVDSVETLASGILAKTNRGTSIRAKTLIAATGYETGALFDTARFVDLNSSFAIASEPLLENEFWWRRCLLWESSRPYFYLRTDSQNRAILGGADIPFKNAAARDKLIPAKASNLASTFSSLFPSVRLETAFEWAGTFGETKDGLAYIGPYEKHPHCLFALGFGGNGITYSVIATEILRHHLKGKTHRYADVFRFDR